MSSPIDTYSQQVAEMIVDANEENDRAINSFVNENYTYSEKNNNVTSYNEKNNNSNTNWIYITQKSNETDTNYDLIKYKLYRTNESPPRLYVLKDNMRIYISTNVIPDYESILKEINFMVEENFQDKKGYYEMRYEREKKNIEETLKKIEIKLNIEREKRNSDKEDYELKCIEEYSNENLNFKQTFDFMTFRKEKNTKDKEASKSTKSDTKNEIIDHKAFEFVSSEANRVQYYTNIRGVKTITSDIYKTKIPCPFNCVSHLRATVEGSRREMLKQCRKNPNSQWCVTSCKNNYKPTEEELCAYYEKFKK